MRKIVRGLLGLVLMGSLVLGYNNCIGGDGGGFQLESISAGFLEKNPLQWLPNRLASFSCSRYQFDIGDPRSYPYPTFMVWQSQYQEYFSSDPRRAGFIVKKEAIDFLKKDHNLTALNDIKAYIPDVSPMFYPMADSTNGVVEGRSSGWQYSPSGPLNYGKDEKLRSHGSQLTRLVNGWKVDINPMYFTLRAGQHYQTDLGFGFAMTKEEIPYMQLTFSMSAGEDVQNFIAGSALQVTFQGRAINIPPNDAQIGLVPFEPTGLDKAQVSGVGSPYKQQWSCEQYFVTRPKGVGQSNKCVVNNSMEPDNPLHVDSPTTTPAAKGKFGTYKGIKCFRPEKQFKYACNPQLQGGKIMDPIELAENPNANTVWHQSPQPWAIDENVDQFAPMWLTVCKRTTCLKNQICNK